jgi:hypothetical protein
MLQKAPVAVMQDVVLRIQIASLHCFGTKDLFDESHRLSSIDKAAAAWSPYPPKSLARINTASAVNPLQFAAVVERMAASGSSLPRVVLSTTQASQHRTGEPRGRRMKNFVKRIPLIGPLARQLYHLVNPPPPFPGSTRYWETRYEAGDNSGAGSYALFAEFKAEVLNKFVADHSVESVIEFGCGDGNQLSYSQYPSYLGLDVSEVALAMCTRRFGSDTTKAFLPVEAYDGQRADLALSLDVIYHLVEESVFDEYMKALLVAARRYVIVYSSNHDDATGTDGLHVRHRRFSSWMERHRPEWKLVAHVPNRYPYRGDASTGSFADFFVYSNAS